MTCNKYIYIYIYIYTHAYISTATGALQARGSSELRVSCPRLAFDLTSRHRTLWSLEIMTNAP